MIPAFIFMASFPIIIDRNHFISKPMGSFSLHRKPIATSKRF